MTAIIFGVATISNNNLQDLKTGQLVEATPWRQQVALVLGVVFGAIVIPPILDLMNTAFTFQGAPGAKETALAAPQAAIISTIAQGVLGGSLDWGLIRQGAIIGVVAVIVDEVLKRTSGKRLHLPPLAIGMGIYLPLEADLLIPFGAVLGWFYNRWAMQSKSPAFAERMGVLMATGLIVGESLMGVVYAFAVAGAEKAGSADSANVFALVEPYSAVMLVSLVVFSAAIAALYYWTKGRASDAPAPDDGRIADEADLPLAAEHLAAKRPAARASAPPSALRISSTILRLTGAFAPSRSASATSSPLMIIDLGLAARRPGRRPSTSAPWRRSSTPSGRHC